MINTKTNSVENGYVPTYFTSYHVVEKTRKVGWYDVAPSDEKSEPSMQSFFNQITVMKALQPKRIIIQKQETGNGYSFRIAVSKKLENRFLGELPNSTGRCVLIIMPSRKPYVEIFFCHLLSETIYSIFKMLEAGVLDDEIKFHRREYGYNKLNPKIHQGE
jgi:hypothetical protein